MSSQNISSSLNTPIDSKDTKKLIPLEAPTKPPANSDSTDTRFSSFWWNRVIEGGLVLSMALYYLVGNPNISIGKLSHINPLYSLPFLLLFAVLCWYRLPFAVALLPLALPYYLQQKVVVNHYEFSLAEVTLATCVLVALSQIVFFRRHWKYWLSWSELWNRLGPFTLPILVFFLAAVLSIFIAFQHTFALRAFREEVFDPLLYVLLALTCLRSRQDVMRLLGALLGSALLIAILGLAQYFIFKQTLILEDGVRRVHAVYGSANSIGLFFDYVLPIGLALLLSRVSSRLRLLAALLCVPLLIVLYLTQSLGAWVAIALAALFVIMLSLRDRKLLLLGGGVLAAGVVIALLVFHRQVIDLVVQHHTSAHGTATASAVTKRLYLWESALHMIHDSPWVGYGMDNWLCHYSANTICDAHYHYWIEVDPVTHVDTGLRYEAYLSHPHNIFLHMWVSVGIFGLLAFVAILVLFYWLFARVFSHLNVAKTKEQEQLRWMTIGVGAAMLAALIQGLVDSAFLEQDLAFCFWMLVLALLLLRMFANVPWRTKLPQT